MASLGQLAAGIAHEIYNPISFIGSNLQLMQEQVADLYAMQNELATKLVEPHSQQLLAALQKQYDCEFLKQEFVELFADCKLGVDRVSHIVKSLKTYSQSNDSRWYLSDVCEGIGLTLKILKNQLPDKCEVIEHHTETPLSYCINH